MPAPADSTIPPMPLATPVVVSGRKAASPTSDQVRRAIHGLSLSDPHRVRVQAIEYTERGQPIDAVTLTDPTVCDSTKQSVLIVAGQHGNEESGRLTALALMRRLLDEDHASTLRRQKIVVMPNVNPDGAEDDSHETPGGVRPNMDHGPDGPTTPEGRAVERVAGELCPDLFIDMHARGHAGCSYDMVLYPHTRSYTEDDNFFHRIAHEMCAAGESAGLPHITHPLSWWTEPSEDGSATTAYAYRRFKSIVMLTESAEDNEYAYPQELTARVGVARVLAVLAWGNRRYSKLYYPGYPNALVLGMFSVGVVAAGETAAQRRHSRVEIWRHRSAFHSIRPLLPEPANRKTLLIDYQGPTLTCGVGLMLRAAGHRAIEQVRCRGRRLSPSQTDGYYTYRDECSTYVVTAMPQLDAGAWDIEVDLN